MRSILSWISSIGLAVLAYPAQPQGCSEAVRASLQAMSATVQADDVVELQLTLSVSSPWHVYADTPGSTGQISLDLEMTTPDGVEVMGDWVWPAYESVFEGYEVHLYEAGEHLFRRKLKIVDSTGPVHLSVKLTYQACTPEFCAPAETIELSTELGNADIQTNSAASELPPVPDRRCSGIPLAHHRRSFP